MNDAIETAAELSSDTRGNMLAEVERRRFTTAEYHRMAETGILVRGERVELIEGEIVLMSPIGDRHLLCVNRALELFVLAFIGRAIVSIQNPVKLNLHNEPEPDVLVYQPTAGHHYSTRPSVRNCCFLVEVADSSLAYDTNVKLPLYAKAGVPEVWIEDLKGDCLLVHRDLEQGVYKTSLTLGPHDTVSPSAFPEKSFSVRNLLLTGLSIVD